MKHLSILFLPWVAVVLAGCGPKDTAGTEAQSEKASLFKEGKGVVFSDETKKLFGLEVAEVTETPMRRRLEKMAQVYRAGREDSPASAMLLLSVEEAKGLKVGQTVKLRLGDAPEIDGTLVRLDTQTQTVLSQIEGLVDFADPQRVCPAGAFMTATFASDEGNPVFVVPERALLNAADGSYVYTVNGTHLSRTRVQPGAVNDGVVEIEDGLYAGDLVAVNGRDSLWLVELCALKGGTPCCPVSKKAP